MPPAAEAKDLIRDIAGPMPAGSQIQEMLAAVAGETRLSFGRLRRIWHGEAKAILSKEMDALRKAAARKKAESEANDRELYQDLKSQIAAIQDHMAEMAAQLARAMAAAQGRPPDEEADPESVGDQTPSCFSEAHRSMAGA